MSHDPPHIPSPPRMPGASRSEDTQPIARPGPAALPTPQPPFATAGLAAVTAHQGPQPIAGFAPPEADEAPTLPPDQMPAHLSGQMPAYRTGQLPSIPTHRTGQLPAAPAHVSGQMPMAPAHVTGQMPVVPPSGGARPREHSMTTAQFNAVSAQHDPFMTGRMSAITQTQPGYHLSDTFKEEPDRISYGIWGAAVGCIIGIVFGILNALFEGVYPMENQGALIIFTLFGLFTGGALSAAVPHKVSQLIRDLFFFYR